MRKRIVAMLMLLVLCFSFVPHVQAEEEVTQKHILQVKRVEGKTKTDTTLNVLRIGDAWYAQQESLAELVGCNATYNESSGIIGFVRQSPRVILCTFKEEQCVQSRGNWYVPLQEAACKTGLEFDVRDGQIYTTVWRTPRDIENLLSEIFRLERLNLTTFMLSIPESLLIVDWEFAKLYAIVTNIWNPSSWVKVLSGYDTLEQYEQIMAQILTSGEETTGLFASLAEGDKMLNKSAKVSKALWEILMFPSKVEAVVLSDNKEMYEFYTSLAEIEMLQELGSLGEVKEFLDTYKEIGGIVPVTESLKMLAFLELAGDADDALLHAMDLVFSNSENEDAKAAVAKIKAYHNKGVATLPVTFSDMGLRFLNFYMDKATGEMIKELLNGKTLLLNVGKVLTKAETLMLNGLFHVSDAADFIQYLPIYASIQVELSGYYWRNVDSTIQNMYDLRSCGIMYVKAVLSACENLEFDKSLKETIEAEKTTAKNYLTLLLSYVEEEYNPTYNNAELIAYLQETYPEEQEAAFRWKNAQELLDAYPYWSWQTGVTNAGLCPVKLYEDGTAQYVDYYSINGTELTPVHWSYEDGILYYCGDEYYWTGTSFESAETYQMQVHFYLPYRLYPDKDGSAKEEFDEEYERINGSQAAPTPYVAPATTPTPAPYTPTETWNPSINDMLEVGDYIAFGTYERDNDLYNGPEDLPWIVLDKVGDEVLLISRFVLDCDVYHSEKDTSVQWSNSELRYWLNNTFYQQTFSEEEKAKIIEKEVPAESNPDYGTYAGVSTKDKVTLLSISEAQKYFSGNSDRACKATEYAIAQGVQVDNNGNSWWWLRTPGQLDGYAAGVFRNGEIDPIGDIFYHEGDGIRPVIWVNFDKDTSSYTTDSSTKGSGADLSAEELVWFNTRFPYSDDGFIYIMDEDGAPASWGTFYGYMIPWTAQFYSEDSGIVLFRIMRERYFEDYPLSAEFVNGLKVGDRLELGENLSEEIRRIDYDNDAYYINDFAAVLIKQSDESFVYREARYIEYGEEGMLAWIPLDNDTYFDGNFSPMIKSYREYIRAYDGWLLEFVLQDDRCSFMCEDGFAG